MLSDRGQQLQMFFGGSELSQAWLQCVKTIQKFLISPSYICLTRLKVTFVIIALN